MENQDENAILESAILKNQSDSYKIRYAGFWIRYAAFMVDVLIMAVPIILLSFLLLFLLPYVFGIANANEQSLDALIIRVLVRFVSVGAFWVYFIAMTKKYQATPGKMLVGINVRSEKSESLTLGQLVIRETLGKLISSLVIFIGYIMAGFTKNKQALHDKLAVTAVVYMDPPKIIRTWLWAVIILIAGVVSLFALGALSFVISKSNETVLGGAPNQAVNRVMGNKPGTGAPVKAVSLGFEIKPPTSWKNTKSVDKKTGVVSLIMIPDVSKPTAGITIRKLTSQKPLDATAPEKFIRSAEKKITDTNGKVSDEKDFIYKYADGSTSTGKAFKAEYEKKGNSVKQWMIAVPNGNKLFLFTYTSDAGQYDANLDVVLAALDSWKIKK